ncbi:unnamed protein product [Didymodactylos carnosus]|uniref:Uncharacterized protein n=1 Tax=Didymodactylos carnosus TaxID=1234261 RepID=A0A814RIX1_9BILA|nr:unnamed protein product [Didymodactylos carnosus]CAF3897803.1 unnamed protein product [Didymodactylos carnosus]
MHKSHYQADNTTQINSINMASDKKSCSIFRCSGTKSQSTQKTTPKFNAKSTAREVVESLQANLTGKVILITGATSGIGVETARALALTKAHIIITARNMEKGADVVNDIKTTTNNNNVEVMELNQNSLKSVRDFANEYIKRKLPLHILICNAGIMATPYQKTIDGYESQFAVNHLSHFLLTILLLPVLKASKPSKVIVVSSCANRQGGINWNDINWEQNYDKWKAYAQSKTSNILFAKQLSKLYSNDGIKAYSLHPGGIMTGLQKDLTREEMNQMGFFDKNGNLIEAFKNVEQGAATTVWAALSNELDDKSGEYLEDCNISVGVTNEQGYFGLSPHSVDMEQAQRLWDISLEMTELK